MKNFNIAQLAVDVRKMTFDYPEAPGFQVELAYVANPAAAKIREQSNVTNIDGESGLPYTQLDVDLYLENYAKAVIVGWKGLTIGVLSKLMLIDEAGADPKEVVEYNVDNAVALLKYS